MITINFDGDQLIEDFSSLFDSSRDVKPSGVSLIDDSLDSDAVVFNDVSVIVEGEVILQPGDDGRRVSCHSALDVSVTPSLHQGLGRRAVFECDVSCVCRVQRVCKSESSVQSSIEGD